MIGLAAIIPNNVWSNRPVDWHPLDAGALNALMSKRMPAVSPENEDITSEDVIQRMTGKALTFIPPRPDQGTHGIKWTYRRDMEPWMREGSVPTLGEFLLAQLSSDNEAGDAIIRTLAVQHPVGMPAQHHRDRAKSLPKMLDVIIATDRCIAVIAVAKE
jgi:hypothetical protein